MRFRGERVTEFIEAFDEAHKKVDDDGEETEEDEVEPLGLRGGMQQKRIVAALLVRRYRIGTTRQGSPGPRAAAESTELWRKALPTLMPRPRRAPSVLESRPRRNRRPSLTPLPLDLGAARAQWTPRPRVRFDKLRDKYVDAANYERKFRKSL